MATTPKRRIEYVSLEKIRKAKNNPKAHDNEAITGSVGRFGYVEAIVEDERTGRLVAGHGRLRALSELKKAGGKAPDGVQAKGKDWFVPVQRGWASKNDAEAEAYLVAANRTPELGGWDSDELAKMLAKMTPETLEATGFSQGDLDTMLREIEGASSDALGRTPDDLLPGFLNEIGRAHV